MAKRKRSFLKWPGGKYSLVNEIRRHLPEGRLLIEPFVGSGTVFLNTDYQEYWLSDINSDLINLYNIIKHKVDKFVDDSVGLFSRKNNTASAYYCLRQTFNQSQDPYKRALLFLYLNRHGYNGLCRYNKSGGFNVPFGTYSRPYFPEAELYGFAEKAQCATFICEDYLQSLQRSPEKAIIYCDPPYTPLSATANFTNYYSRNFTPEDQSSLAELAYVTMLNRGASLLISNHDTVMARHWYRHAKLTTVQVSRRIGCQVQSRAAVQELLALYHPG